MATAYLGSLSLFVSIRPLLARIASFYLGTRVRLRSLQISPFRKQLSLRGIHLSDPRGRPLVSVDDVHVALRKPEPVEPKSTQKKVVDLPKRIVDVTLTKPAVVAVFDKYDFSESNWTLFVSNFNRRRGGSETTATSPPQKAPTRVSAPSPPSASPATDVRLSVSGGVRLSLRSAVLNNQRLVDDVTLSNVSLSYAELCSPGGLAAFVDALAGRAVRSARVRSFPAEFRTGARRYARRVLADGLAKGIRVGREHVTRARRGVERVDEFVFSDLPDTGGVGEAVKTVRDALRGLESLLGGTADPEERSEGEGTGAQTVDRGDVEYRELDEGEARPQEAQETGP